MDRIEGPSNSERRAYQRAAPLDPGETGMPKRMTAALLHGQKVRVINGDHVGEECTIATIKPGATFPYYLDHESIENGQPLWGPYKAGDLERV